MALGRRGEQGKHVKLPPRILPGGGRDVHPYVGPLPSRSVVSEVRSGSPRSCADHE